MTKIIRLTDIQLVLLSTAAARHNGSPLPPPDTLGDGPARIRKAVEQLIRRGLAAEAQLAPGGDVWRTDGDQAIGVIITDEGRAALRVEPQAAVEALGQDTESPSVPDAIETLAAPLPARTKTAHVLNMLQRDEGATLADLVAATGWLSHTTRAALTGLLKKGHAIERGKRDDVTVYHLKVEA